MLGTIVNVSTIVIGTLLGSLIKKGLNPKIHSALFTSMGLAATGLGVYSIVQNMPNSKYPVLFIASLAIGNLIGTALDLEERFHNVTNRFSKGKTLNMLPSLLVPIVFFLLLSFHSTVFS